MEQLRKLVEHYDISDLIQYLVKEKIVSASEVTSKLGSKEHFIRYIAGKNDDNGFLINVLKEYTLFVYKDATMALDELSRVSVSPYEAKFEYAETESFSSSSSFCEDSDLSQLSQEIPNVRINNY